MGQDSRGFLWLLLIAIVLLRLASLGTYQRRRGLFCSRRQACSAVAPVVSGPTFDNRVHQRVLSAQGKWHNRPLADRR